MNDPIASAYARRVFRKRISLEEVPEEKLETVKVILEQMRLEYKSTIED